MATETSFLKLRKPATTDLEDIKRDVVNNLEVIDRHLGKPIEEPWLDFRQPLSNIGYRVVRCKYKVMGTMLFYQGNILITSVPTGNIILHMPPGTCLPAAYTENDTTPNGTLLGKVAGTSHTGAVIAKNSFTAFLAGSQAGAGIWNATVPVTWATGQSIRWNITCEIQAGFHDV